MPAHVSFHITISVVRPTVKRKPIPSSKSRIPQHLPAFRCTGCLLLSAPLHSAINQTSAVTAHEAEPRYLFRNQYITSIVIPYRSPMPKAPFPCSLRSGRKHTQRRTEHASKKTASGIFYGTLSTQEFTRYYRQLNSSSATLHNAINKPSGNSEK